LFGIEPLGHGDRKLGSGLTFEHLKSQMSEYQTLPQPIVAAGLMASRIPGSL
jgi:hypothetical protein